MDGPVDGHSQRHWRATRRLTAALLALWFVASFVMAFFARELDVVLFGWPFSFYMAAQGSLFVFLLIVVVYARAMDRLDRRLSRPAE
ncbi:MAG TPA: DUF4212 domain-containing protein [Methylibium sp.]|uniref:DUF4212 domain-containing protein n=1 Tax=Methylibium sp. TaxID=2067992 RepID=UPI002DB6D58A|nr:DUF4212 domain-containing protein [Methylibium sp.]HEU4460019.1 DUF4212 domain-containing protein [Methylibium sp.]